MHGFRQLAASTAVAFAAATVGCGNTVEMPREQGSASATGSGGTTTTSTSGTGGQGGCPAHPVNRYGCVDFCGSDFFNAKECKGGAWTCPAGFVDVATCPPIVCGGLPLACEVCGPKGWQCNPEPACLTSCDVIACGECPAGPSGPVTLGACACACNETNQYVCELAPGCCNTDRDCGDVVYQPCVNNVCKSAVDDGCWVDADCTPDKKCIGAVVCPCGYDCDAPDSPGVCG